MQCRVFPLQRSALRAPHCRGARTFCARATSTLDNVERQRLLVIVRLLRPEIPFGRSRRNVSAGSPPVTGKH